MSAAFQRRPPAAARLILFLAGAPTTRMIGAKVPARRPAPANGNDCSAVSTKAGHDELVTSLALSPWEWSGEGMTVGVDCDVSRDDLLSKIITHTPALP